jgi:hypothetical protein
VEYEVVGEGSGHLHRMVPLDVGIGAEQGMFDIRRLHKCYRSIMYRSIKPVRSIARYPKFRIRPYTPSQNLFSLFYDEVDGEGGFPQRWGKVHKVIDIDFEVDGPLSTDGRVMMFHANQIDE